MHALDLEGYSILVPFGENTRYDLVIEVGSRLRRVQCKTGRLRNGVVRFSTCSSYAHHPSPKSVKRDYIGEIEDFAVFCPELGAVYLIRSTTFRRSAERHYASIRRETANARTSASQRSMSCSASTSIEA